MPGPATSEGGAPARIVGRLVGRAYRAALLLYPTGFRRGWGRRMSEHVDRLMDEAAATGGVRRVLAEGARLVPDLAGSVVREWRAAVRGRAGRRRSTRVGRHARSGEGMMATIVRDLRMAARTLRRAPGFTTAVLATLAVGIGANVAMFGTINAAFFRPLPFPEPDRLVLGLTTFDGRVNPVGSAPDYYDYRSEAESFEGLAAFLPFAFSLAVTGADLPEMIPTQIVDRDFFRTLGVSPALGRDFTEAESLDGGEDVVILSHGFWQRRFGGDPSAVGRTLIVGGAPRTVVGVMPAGFGLVVDAQAWLPMRPNGDWRTRRMLRQRARRTTLPLR